MVGGGRSIIDVACSLGLVEQTLGTQSGRPGSTAVMSTASPRDERAEVVRLRRENARLTREMETPRACRGICSNERRPSGPRSQRCGPLSWADFPERPLDCGHPSGYRPPLDWEHSHLTPSHRRRRNSISRQDQPAPGIVGNRRNRRVAPPTREPNPRSNTSNLGRDLQPRTSLTGEESTKPGTSLAQARGLPRRLSSEKQTFRRPTGPARGQVDNASNRAPRGQV